MRTILLSVLLLLLSVFSTTSYGGPIRIVAATSDLGYFAGQLGGDYVTIDVIAAGNRDMHYIEVLPSYMLKVRRADIYLKVGLELDQWSQPIVDGSRNGSIRIVDCSRGIMPLEVPTFKADARHGDLHRFGNPHYWLSPANIPTICRNITDALIHVDPANARVYNENLNDYLRRLEERVAGWKEFKSALQSIEFVSYHNSWPYFCDYFGCRVVDFVEEFAGVAPSPTHVAHLIEHIKVDSIPVIAYQPFHDKRLPRMIAEKTGCADIVLPTSVGGVPGTESYEELIVYIARSLIDAARGPHHE